MIKTFFKDTVLALIVKCVIMLLGLIVPIIIIRTYEPYVVVNYVVSTSLASLIIPFLRYGSTLTLYSPNCNFKTLNFIKRSILTRAMFVTFAVVIYSFFSDKKIFIILGLSLGICQSISSSFSIYLNQKKSFIFSALIDANAVNIIFGFFFIVAQYWGLFSLFSSISVLVIVLTLIFIDSIFASRRALDESLYSELIGSKAERNMFLMNLASSLGLAGALWYSTIMLSPNELVSLKLWERLIAIAIVCPSVLSPLIWSWTNGKVFNKNYKVLLTLFISMSICVLLAISTYYVMSKVHFVSLYFLGSVLLLIPIIQAGGVFGFLLNLSGYSAWILFSTVLGVISQWLVLICSNSIEGFVFAAFLNICFQYAIPVLIYTRNMNNGSSIMKQLFNK